MSLKQKFARSYQKRGFCAFYGKQGSGKTFTIGKIANAIASDPERVFMNVTENSAIPTASKHGFYVYKTRNIQELMEHCDMIANSPDEIDVYIVDSLTEVYNVVRSSYTQEKAKEKKALVDNLKSNPRLSKEQQKLLWAAEKDQKFYEEGNMKLNDWGKLKAPWKTFIDMLQNLDCHVIVTIRGADMYDTSGQAFEKSGLAPKIEGETAYEFDLLVRMVMVEDENGIKNHFAYIEKDNSDTLSNRPIKNPTEKDFMPYFNFINGMSGGKIKGSVNNEEFEDPNMLKRKKYIERINQILEQIGATKKFVALNFSVDLDNVDNDMLESIGIKLSQALKDFSSIQNYLNINERQFAEVYTQVTEKPYKNMDSITLKELSAMVAETY